MTGSTISIFRISERETIVRNFTETEMDMLAEGFCPACGVPHTMYKPDGEPTYLFRVIRMPCGVRMQVPDPTLGWPPNMRFGKIDLDAPVLSTVPAHEHEKLLSKTWSKLRAVWARNER